MEHEVRSIGRPMLRLVMARCQLLTLNLVACTMPTLFLDLISFDVFALNGVLNHLFFVFQSCFFIITFKDNR